MNKDTTEAELTKRLDMVEIHTYLLSIAKVFDEVCTKNHIPYYMLGGTMLGAIRHHGFIPWDDDMDFGVPIEYYRVLVECLERDLPYPFRCCTHKTHPAVLFNYLKIEDMRTCVDDPSFDLPLKDKIGINIDVFPLVKCKERDHRIDLLRKKEFFMGKVFMNSSTHSEEKWRKMAKSLARKLYGNSPKSLQDSIDKHLFKIRKGEFMGNLLGRWKEKEIIPVGWYGSDVRYAFEDTSFIGLKEYDAYLSKLYGDYMLLPSLDKRRSHVDNIYLRNNM